MEGVGITVDTDVLAGIGKMVDKRLVELEAKAKEAAGCDVNVNSPRQLEPLLFDKRLGIERAEAARFSERCFGRVAGVKACKQKALDEARASGSASTMLGRRR